MAPLQGGGEDAGLPSASTTFQPASTYQPKGIATVIQTSTENRAKRADAGCRGHVR